MKSHNNFFKILQKKILPIDSLLKRNLNKLNIYNYQDKKKNLNISSRVFLILIFFIFLILGYLSIPTLYDKNKLKLEFEKQISQQFNLDFDSFETLNYEIFPKPHFVIKNLSILDNKKKELVEVKDLKIFISLKNFLNVKSIQITSLVFENSNFNLTDKNSDFFIKLLDNDFLNANIIIKNSNIFFRNLSEEVLFINNIKNLKYYYNSQKSLNTLKSNNELFDIPYFFELENDKVNKKYFLKFNLKKFNFKIESEQNHSTKDRNGIINFLYLKKKLPIKYQLKSDSLNFQTFEDLLNLNVFSVGVINFKPFFLDLDLKLNEFDIKNLFKSNSILVDFLKTGILNNKNLSINTKLSSKKISPIELDNFLVNFKIEEGLINLDSSQFDWLDYLNLKISNSSIYVKNDNLFFDGLITIDIKNLNMIYQYFQVIKSLKADIRSLQFNFSYNFDQENIKFNTIKVNNIINENVNILSDKTFFVKDNFKNKIYFKNFIDKFLKAYSG